MKLVEEQVRSLDSDSPALPRLPAEAIPENSAAAFPEINQLAAVFRRMLQAITDHHLELVASNRQLAAANQH